MRIGFDVSQTGRTRAGCGYYAHGLITALAAADHHNEYILYPAFGDLYWDPECAAATFRHPRFPATHAPSHFEESQRFWRNPGEDFEARLGNPDLVHSNNFYCPRGLTKARLVYTLHDLSFLVDPSWTTEPNRVGCLDGVFGASTRADWIVANSEYTRRHFLETFPHFSAERISVIHPASRFTTPDNNSPRPPRFENLLPARFWLSVGSIEPRKNHRRLLEAYSLVRTAGGSPALPLVLAGGSGWLMDDFAATLRDMGLAGAVILTGYVSDAELAWLYSHCFAFLYPSLFEGFGMPALEALSLGAVTICSNTTSLPEVVGDAGLLVDPLDARSIAAAMRKVASGEVSRDSLKDAGYQQARRFSWENSAARLIDVYERCAALPHYWD